MCALERDRILKVMRLLAEVVHMRSVEVMGVEGIWNLRMVELESCDGRDRDGAIRRVRVDANIVYT